MLGVLVAGFVACATSVVLTRVLIVLFRRWGIAQPIHDAVAQHAGKRGTPTLGGLAVVLAALAAVTFAGPLSSTRLTSRPALVLLVAVLAGATLGGIDDVLKVLRGRNTLGLRERQKTVLLVVLTGGYVASSLAWPDPCLRPSLARCVGGPLLPPMAWALWVLVVVWLTTNSVNFTDGLDGLLAGCAIPPLVLLASIAYWQHRHPRQYGPTPTLALAVALVALAGACIGFLWWNAAPARIFMGDVGSFALGSALAVSSLLLHVELLIPIFGAVFAVEGLSSLAQRWWFRLTRRFARDRQPRRLLRMAPLHFHLGMIGWSENTVVVRFWIASALLSVAAGAVYYADSLRVVG